MSSVVNGLLESPEARLVLPQNAPVHNHEDPRLPRLLRRLFVDHGFLHPDGRYLQPDRLIDNFFHELRPPENINDIDFLRNVEQRRRMPSRPRSREFSDSPE